MRIPKMELIFGGLLVAFLAVAFILWVKIPDPRGRALRPVTVWYLIECFLEDIGAIRPDPFRHVEG
jgi:hypothetical protein